MKLILPFLFALTTATVPLLAQQPSGTFAITHVRLFDGKLTSLDQTVFVRDGIIATVGQNISLPPGTPEIDGTHRTLLPGLIDAHVHAFRDSFLQEAEALGVTTVLDMFNDPNTVRREKEAEGQSGADIYSAGILATAPKGHGTEYGFDIPTISKPEEARDFVDARLGEGSDYIKIILEDGAIIGRTLPTLDQPTVRALVTAAHERHKLAVCHIGTYEEARDAIDAGADGLMHLFVDRMPDASFADFVAKHHAFVVPTLSVLLSVCGTNAEGRSLAADKRMTNYLAAEDLTTLWRSFGANSHAHFDVTTATIRQLQAARVPILAGTDAPNPGTAFGASLHGELELLVAAGLSTEEALRAATSVPAACFSLKDRGEIAAGKRADLLLVAGDPTTNIANTRDIVAVWKAGRPCDREGYAKTLVHEATASLGGSHPLDLHHGVISDFEDGTLHTQIGAGWAPSTDALFGGKSTVNHEVISEGANETRKSLRISGNIATGSPYPWSGMMFNPAEIPMAPADLSNATGIEFWARGDGKTYRLMLFSASNGAIPMVVNFNGGAEWKHFTFPLSAFGNMDGHDIEGILFTGGPDTGKFSFEIDEVRLIPK